MHSDNEEEEGKGRSVNRPHKRLKYQNIPMVVALLSLEQWCNIHVHGTNWPWLTESAIVMIGNGGEARCCW